ncbi:hypothetical protein P3T37_001880 [Kitasatospora sp. MAA4]|uniref:hypothetical protein n=1 Tax=Kitasatospora sp. MAA4 TaxID=3035093 RepID=UPI00247512E8|nr:hypothetical protein [Kitasatospora sp. MAA4]MDH6132495.1 hypothetical protein [Kitasatospora sp. MAA4]
MTGVSAAIPDEGAVDDWLDRQREALIGGLAERLDVEAGLRAVRIYARRDDLVGDLGRALDVESGLAAILPPPTVVASTSGRVTHFRSDGEAVALGITRQFIENLPPATRLGLRRHPICMASSRGRLVVRVVKLAYELSSDLAAIREVEGSPALHLQLAAARARSRARALARDLSRHPALAHALAAVLALSRSLAGDPALAVARDNARSLARELALDIVKLLTPAGPRTRRAPAAPGAQAFARRLALDLAYTADSRDEIELAAVLAHALDHQVGDLLELKHAEGLGAVLLAGALDDFTDADLSDVDLSAVDLTGVRWSEWGTRWPATVDIARLRSESQETEPGSGVYVVAPGTATVDLTTLV